MIFLTSSEVFPLVRMVGAALWMDLVASLTDVTFAKTLFSDVTHVIGEQKKCTLNPNWGISRFSTLDAHFVTLEGRML